MTFIQHAGVSKRIRLSQFRFEKIQWQYVLYIGYFANLIKIGPVTPEKLQIVLRFDDRLSFATWRYEINWNITILISAG